MVWNNKEKDLMLVKTYPRKSYVQSYNIVMTLPNLQWQLLVYFVRVVRQPIRGKFVRADYWMTKQLFRQSWSNTQAALMLDSGRFNLQANTDKIQHLL